MSWSDQSSQITTGAEVFGADGGKVGEVAEVYPTYVVVEKGIFFPTDYFIPTSAIAQQRDGQIYLNVSKDDALHRGWDMRPNDLMAAGATTTPLTDAYDDQVIGSAQAVDQDEIRIPLVEEELTATVRPQEAGAVRIAKDVVAEEQSIDVPVTEERLRVERRVVDRPVDATDADILQETVIEVPLRTEAVDVAKEARVREEVVVSKEAVQKTERVSGTVRREEVHVEGDSTIDPALLEGTDEASGRAI